MKTIQYYSRVIIVVFVILITACSGSNKAVTAPTLSQLSLSPPVLATGIPINQPVTFLVEGIFSDNSSKDVTASVTWLSSNTTVAIVDKGVVTGKSEGTVIISAKVNTLSTSITLEVNSNLNLTKLTLTPFSNAVLGIGSKRTLTATATFSDGLETTNLNVSDSADWQSENTSVVKFTEPAVAEGVAKGSTMVRAVVVFNGSNVRSNGMAIVVDSLPNIVTPQLTISPQQKNGEFLIPGFPVQLSAFLTRSDGSRGPVSDADWVSSNPEVLLVSDISSSKGLVLALKKGDAMISAQMTTAEGQHLASSVSYKVSDDLLVSTRFNTPKSLPSGVDFKVSVIGKLQSDGSEISLNDYVQLSIVKTNVSDPDIATVSNSGSRRGYLTGLQAGAVTLKATIPDSLLSVSTTFNIVDVVLSPITLRPSSLGALAVGLKHQLQAVARATIDGVSQEFDITSYANFYSSNPAVADVSNTTATRGLVTARSIGSTVLTADYTGSTASVGVNLTVTPATLSRIDVSPVNPSLALYSKALQFSAAAVFSDASSIDVTETMTWHSSNRAVAQLSSRDHSHGLMEVSSAGLSSITAIYEGRSSVPQQLTVNDARPTGISISGVNSGFKGVPFQLVATATMDDSTTQDVTLGTSWTTDDGDIATVFEGRVTGVMAGTTSIRVNTPNGHQAVLMVTITAI